MPEERRDEHRDERREEKNNKAVLWPWILAGGMLGSSLIMCLCGRGCTKGTGCGGDCGKTKHDTVWVVKEDPSIKVGGDAVIINGNNNDATLIKGNGNNVANRSQGNQNTRPAKPRKTVPVVNPAPVVEPKPEPTPEPKPEPKPQCVTETVTEHTHIVISGRPDDVMRTVVRVMNNGNCR